MPRPTDDETPDRDIWIGLYAIFENDAALKMALDAWFDEVGKAR